MQTVIYKTKTLKVVRITTEEVNLSNIKDDEDFMPLTLWLEGGGKI